uniref:Uncharacterized protein n=1 Tax=Panagrolaimus sp. JU765 TaxID=591449 RepID=A0AC34QDG9_9BILA
MGVWLAFTYSTRVVTTGETTGYVIAGLLLVLQTTFYTAPSIMLYPKIKDESKPRYNVHGSYENDEDISYQGAPTPRMV